MLQKGYLLLLGKSYGKPLSRKEWDSLPEIPRSREVLASLDLNSWAEYQRLCGYKAQEFTRKEMIAYGRGIRKDIRLVSPERWDKLAAFYKSSAADSMPSSTDILSVFGDWLRYQRSVKHKSNQDPDMANAEALFLQGVALRNIAQRIGKKERELARHLEGIGLFTPEYVEENLPSVEAITGRQMLDIKFYGGKDKQDVRELMCEGISGISDPSNLRYCGLPGPNFIDYSLLYDTFGVAPEKSLAAESDRVSGNAMFSIIRAWDRIRGGERFRRLKLYLGAIEEALGSKQCSDMKFNVVNFDWIGGWAKDKQSAVVNLFASDHLDNEAVVFLTLNDSLVERGRAQRGRGYRLDHEGGETHIRIAQRSLEYNAGKAGMGVKELFKVPYSDTVDMLSAGYLLWRRKK